MRRTPKNYDGTKVTTHKVSDLLSSVLEKIGETYEQHPDLIMAAWDGIIGPQLAPMTKVVGFSEGVLTVKVKNSTFYSLLSQEKLRVLNILKTKFPNAQIQKIWLRIG
jgi:predicted nucleic acid-binding Zn ribbon protein